MALAGWYVTSVPVPLDLAPEVRLPRKETSDASSPKCSKALLSPAEPTKDLLFSQNPRPCG